MFFVSKGNPFLTFLVCFPGHQAPSEKGFLRRDESAPNKSKTCIVEMSSEGRQNTFKRAAS